MKNRRYRYYLLFPSLLFFLYLLQVIVIGIPNSWIEKNMQKSIVIHSDHEYLYRFNEYDMNRSVWIDNYADDITLNILWNGNKNGNILKSQIDMKYYLLEYKNSSENLYDTFYNGKEANYSYSRYWHGSIIYIKPLLIFFNIKQIKIINLIFVMVLVFYLFYLIFKKNKILSIMFLVSLIMINILVVCFCFEYYFAFLIMLIMAIVTMKTLDKDDNFFYLLMMSSGILTCFFDFLTCETITICIPLLLRYYFNRKSSLKDNVMFIVRSGFLWGISYGLTYLVKWLLVVIVYGFKEAINIYNYARIRVYQSYSGGYFVTVLKTFYGYFNNIIPFKYFEWGPVVVTILLLGIIYLVSSRINKIKWNQMIGFLIILCVPIARIFVIYSHSYAHSFFAYRSFITFIFCLMIIVLESVGCNGNNNINSLSKRRKNNRKSN